jgi:hypothetical protein
MFVAVFVCGSFDVALGCLVRILAALAMYAWAVLINVRSLRAARSSDITYLNLGLCWLV